MNEGWGTWGGGTWGAGRWGMGPLVIGPYVDASATVIAVAVVSARASQIASGAAAVSVSPTVTAYATRLITAEATTFTARAYATAAATTIADASATVTARGSMSAEAAVFRGLSFTFGPLGAGQVLVVDARALTVTLDGENARKSWSGDYIYLSPGVQKIRYTDEQADREAEIEIRRRERWA